MELAAGGTTLLLLWITTSRSQLASNCSTVGATNFPQNLLGTMPSSSIVQYLVLPTFLLTTSKPQAHMGLPSIFCSEHRSKPPCHSAPEMREAGPSRSLESRDTNPQAPKFWRAQFTSRVVLATSPGIRSSTLGILRTGLASVISQHIISHLNLPGGLAILPMSISAWHASYPHKLRVLDSP